MSFRSIVPIDIIVLFFVVFKYTGRLSHISSASIVARPTAQGEMKFGISLELNITGIR